MKRSFISLLFVGLAVAAIMYLKQQKRPVQQRPVASVDYNALIHLHGDQASRRNQNAFASFEVEVNRILAAHMPKLESAGKKAATEAADYASCTKVVYYLAYDKVRKQNHTELYLDSEIRPFIETPTRALASDLDAAVQRLDHELRRSTVEMAAALATLTPGTKAGQIAVEGSKIDEANLREALRNLGFDAAGVTVAVGFDAWAVCNSQLVRSLWNKLIAIAQRLFAKQVAKLAASLSLIPLDGPFPIGDILAVAGIIWTGIDVHNAQQQFQKELETSISNQLAEAKAIVHKQAIEHAIALVKQYQSAQDSIGSQAVSQLLRTK